MYKLLLLLAISSPLLTAAGDICPREPEEVGEGEEAAEEVLPAFAAAGGDTYYKDDGAAKGG